MSRYVTLLFVTVLCFYGGISFLWIFGEQTLYFEVLRSLGAQPWARPFLDMAGVLLWSDCHHRGVDVLRLNPCDPLNRLLDYSPLLLQLPPQLADTTLAGVVQDGAFLLAAPLVLWPRSLPELAVSIIACVSAVANFGLF